MTTITNNSRGLGNAAISVTVAYDTDLDRVTTYPKTLQLLEELVPDATTRQKILVDTPARLYGF